MATITKGFYEVNLRLAVPNGREINVARTAPQDERYTEVDFAINDAFKRARRRLQDHVRRMQGHVKEHEGQPVSKVIRIDPEADLDFWKPPTIAKSIFTGTTYSTTDSHACRSVRAWRSPRSKARGTAGEPALSPDRKRQIEQGTGMELAASGIECPLRQRAVSGQFDIETHATQVPRQVVEGAAIGVAHWQQGDAGHVGHGID